MIVKMTFKNGAGSVIMTIDSAMARLASEMIDNLLYKLTAGVVIETATVSYQKFTMPMEAL
jgi:hypothetical protein